jgi:hypothetical protein
MGTLKIGDLVTVGPNNQAGLILAERSTTTMSKKDEKLFLFVWFSEQEGVKFQWITDDQAKLIKA